MTFLLSDLPDRIARRIVVDPATGCWLWQGAITGKGAGDKANGGYGTIKWERKMQGVHRVVYTLLVGLIPDGMELDHVKARGCLHRHCCWPAHLEPITHRVNMLRGDTFQARNAAKTHCKRGHEFTPENTYRDPKGQRNCRTCEKAKWRRYQGYTGIGSPQVRNAAKTHCKRGHEFTPENTYRDKAGIRSCRECNRIRQREYLERRAMRATLPGS